MIKCALDTNSFDLFIDLKSNDKIIVSLEFTSNKDIAISLSDSSALSATSKLPDLGINNLEYFPIWMEWDDEYFRNGTGYILGQNELKKINGAVHNIDEIMRWDTEADLKNGNIITMQFVDTNAPKLCWTKASEAVASQIWMNTDLDDLWMTDHEIIETRIPTEISSMIFNGPYESNKHISKSLATIHEHDFIQIQARVYGFGDWDVIYPTLLNSLSLSFNNGQNKELTLIWFGTFLSNGGSTKSQCQISDYKQWFNWERSSAFSGLPIDILTDDICIYDVNLYLKHNITKTPVTFSIQADLDQYSTTSQKIIGSKYINSSQKCVCDDCDFAAGDKYHYVYMENENQFKKPLLSNR